MSEKNYLDINRKSWNERVGLHVDSEFYDNEAFLAGKPSLKVIELSLLGDVKGKTILHLQCHFGQDSISLARMGAAVTAVDLSDKAIETGQKMSQSLGFDVDFVCSDVYEAPMHIDRKFDIVFTSYGVIGWLPDMDKWASVIAHFLKPGGKLVFVEFHPVVWMFDDDFKQVTYKYDKADPIVEQLSGTYADQDAGVSLDTVSWNHGLAEVFSALMANGLVITAFQEFDYSPYNCFRHMDECEPGKFRVKHLGDRIPMVYALEARRPSV